MKDIEPADTLGDKAFEQLLNLAAVRLSREIGRLSPEGAIDWETTAKIAMALYEGNETECLIQLLAQLEFGRIER